MQNFDLVKYILEQHINLDKNPAFIFGSRTTSSFRDSSDLDILILDESISPAVVTKLQEAFEESDLLFKVDLVLRSRISDEFFRQIKDSLVPL